MSSSNDHQVNNICSFVSKTKNTTYLLLVIACLIGCKSQKSKTLPAAETIKLISSGGVGGDRTLCATAPNDVVVPLKSLNLPPLPGEPTMTIDGVYKFIKENDIRTITELLNKLPIYYRTNFSLVEVTKATGMSTLEFPRIILFGSDGSFLANVGTLKEDPKYNLLDVAELHEDTGQWEFSVFDFTGKKPKLDRNPESCKECHGHKEPRPVWGTNLDWPGAFGDNIAAGPQGEALDTKHLLRMREIRDGKGGSDRFDFLVWANQKLHRGGKRRIANHAFGADLFISNLAMGAATARGTFIRLRKNHPKRYIELRETLILLAYEQVEPRILTKEDKEKLSKKLSKYGIEVPTLDNVLAALGINTSEAFSLATLADKEPPNPMWKMGSGTIYEAVLLQVLDDMSKDDPELDKRLKSAHPGRGVFACPNLAKNIKDIIDIKMLYFFHLKGRSKYEVNRVFAPLDLEHINKTVFLPTVSVVGRYIKKKVLGS